jgi:hypothetical protein
MAWRTLMLAGGRLSHYRVTWAQFEDRRLFDTAGRPRRFIGPSRHRRNDLIAAQPRGESAGFGCPFDMASRHRSRLIGWR